MASPRATGDLDVLIDTSAGNSTRVIEALERFGAPIEAHGVTAIDFQRPGTVYQIGIPPRRIDILTSISGVTFDEAVETRVVHEVQGLLVPFLGREALIRNKRAAGRPKDLVDAQRLEWQE